MFHYFDGYVQQLYNKLPEAIPVHRHQFGVFCFRPTKRPGAAAGTRFAHQRQEIHSGGTPQRRSAEAGAVVLYGNQLERSTSRLPQLSSLKNGWLNVVNYIK